MVKIPEGEQGESSFRDNVKLFQALKLMELLTGSVP